MDSKFKVGDVVWGAKSYKKDKRIQCPDCKGKLVWCVTLPNGEQFTVPCSTCERGFDGCQGTITEWIQSPIIEQLTIGSVMMNSNDERPISYMCYETGIGSGRIHYEENLHKDKTLALKHATQKAISVCEEENEHTRKISELGKKKSKRNRLRK